MEFGPVEGPDAVPRVRSAPGRSDGAALIASEGGLCALASRRAEETVGGSRDPPVLFFFRFRDFCVYQSRSVSPFPLREGGRGLGPNGLPNVGQVDLPAVPRVRRVYGDQAAVRAVARMKVAAPFAGVFGGRGEDAQIHASAA